MSKRSEGSRRPPDVSPPPPDDAAASARPGASLRPAVFTGTHQEREGLLAAVRHNCARRSPGVGERAGVCGAHALLLDRAALKRLIFYRRWRLALWRSEWLEGPRWRDA